MTVVCDVQVKPQRDRFVGGPCEDEYLPERPIEQHTDNAWLTTRRNTRFGACHAATVACSRTCGDCVGEAPKKESGPPCRATA